MSIKRLSKIDRYYPILAIVVVGLTILLIFTFNGIFRALNTASEFDPNLANPSSKVDKTKLDEVYEKIKNRNIPVINVTP